MIQFHVIQKAAPKSKRRRKRPKSHTQRLEALAKTFSNAIHIDLLNGIRGFKKKVSAEKIAEAWATGDYHKVQTFIPWDEMPKALEKAVASIGKATMGGVKHQLNELPKNVNERLRVDETNPRIRQFLRNRTASLVYGIQQETAVTIQNAVTRTFTHARTPREVANEIKGSIGLLPAHEKAVDKYREGLKVSGSSPKQIEELAGAYEERLLDYRAMMIARTETQAATQNGQLAVWREGMDKGYIDREKAQKVWVLGSEDACDICEPMDGLSVAIDGAWILEDGRAVYNPAESHPNCFCVMALELGEAEE